MIIDQQIQIPEDIAEKQEIRKTAIRAMIEPAQTHLAFKNIPENKDLSSGQQSSLSHGLISVTINNDDFPEFKGARGIAMPISPFPLKLDAIPKEVNQITSNLEVFFTQALPLIVKEFPFLASVLDISENDFGLEEFAQRYDAVFDQFGGIKIIDENGFEGGLPHIAPRLEILLSNEEESFQGFNFESMANAMLNKFDKILASSKQVPKGPIVYITSESPFSMTSARRFEIEALSKFTDIVHLSAHEILNSEVDFINENGEIVINGIVCNRVVNFLNTGGFVSSPSFVERLKSFSDNLFQQNCLAILNKPGGSGKLLSARKMELALIRLPSVQEFLRENLPTIDLDLILETTSNRRLMFVNTRGGKINIESLSNITKDGFVMESIFNGNKNIFTKAFGDFFKSGQWIKDPFGTGGRGIFKINKASDMKDGDVGRLLGFFKSFGFHSNHGKIFIIEDDIVPPEIEMITPQGIFNMDFDPKPVNCRFEIFHSMGKVLGLSATMSPSEKVQGGGGSFIQPIIIKK